MTKIPTITDRQRAAFARAQQLVARAADIAGHVPIYGSRHGQTVTYKLRELRGLATNGAWITSCPTESLTAYVHLQRAGHAALVARCHDIIRRELQIRAARDARFAAAMET